MKKGARFQLKIGFIALLLLGGVGMFAWIVPQSPKVESFVYRTIEGRSLSLDVYRPVGWNPSDRRACVVWFFGGAWEVGAPVQNAKLAKDLAGLGVVAITPDYRVRQRHGLETTPFDALDDARSAIRWIREHASGFGVDPDRIVVGGSSSGGQLAAACSVLASVPMSEAPNALVLINPLVDFEIPFVVQRTTAAQRGGLAAISPLAQIENPLPPTLILHGTLDGIIPLATSESFATKAREIGSEKVELIRFPGRGHEFHLGGYTARRGHGAVMREFEAFLAGLGWID